MDGDAMDVRGTDADAAARIEAAQIGAREAQYASYVQWAERLIDRRAEANRFYLALNTALIGAIGFLFSDRLELALLPSEHVAAAIALLGVVVSWNWRCIIKSQREIVRAKFKIIHALEAELPSKPYTAEWELEDGDRQKHSAGRFELRPASLFTALYLVTLVVLAGHIAFGASLDIGGWIGQLRALVGL